jgi:protein TonB
MTDIAMATAPSRVPSQAPPTSVQPIASNQPSVARADYSWLQRAVSRRLEELKRFSHPSLDDASKLKILVKAVVSSKGELMEAEVVTSSGLDRIDQEAMTLVQRAFPMPLDYAIDRPQIIMRIPITYSRD